ncbi:MAG TPA: MBL fold metallo-hydrolase RNA specificity domain-containing protein [Candidatus Aquilonibacter sp.]|nr:MBL fold metallo-hydrolase RNA specificity domain-containing protein [Candidatus Aquilonibacter sp.]
MFRLAEKSLYVDALDLWIDSMRTRERCYVSHGHSDHAREHQVVVTTPNTASICRARFSRRRAEPPQLSLLPREERRRVDVTFEEHPYNESWIEGDHRLTLFSAGHVLGSSQLLIEGEAGSFVYTGDFKLAESFTAEAPEVKRCDVVLMECTYGRPQYVFPPRDEVAGAMVQFARETLEHDAVPVFFAYSLGKAQEAIAILGNAGIPITVHGAVETITKVYEACGVPMPPYKRYHAEDFDTSSALVWPPGGKALPKALRDREVRTAVLTGWSLDRGALFRYGTQRGFALSDHADYPSLLRYIERAQPKKVLLNHGWRDFVYRLRALGVDAEYLEEHAQLTLF